MTAKLYRLDLKKHSDSLLNLDSAEILARLNAGVRDGNADAMRILGVMLTEGRDPCGRSVERDGAQGLKLLTRAASLGDVNAMAYLGLCLAEGRDGVAEDRSAAGQWLLKAAEEGSSAGKYALALLMLKEADGIRDDGKIFELMNEAASDGLIEARLRVADFYHEGRGVRRSVKKAIALFEELSKADAEIPEADYRLGLIYDDYTSSYYRPKKALRCLEKAAGKDHPEAMKALARRYEEDPLDDVFDPYAAVSLYRRYLKYRPHDGEALFKIPEYLWLKKLPLCESYKDEALDCLQRAADENHPMALMLTAEFFLNGRHGYKRNAQHARELILKAGRGDDAMVQVEIGRMYRDGCVFVKDYAEALKYFRRAAEKDNSHAWCELGRMYRDGLGLAKNRTEALNCLFRSAFGGCFFGKFEFGKLLTESDDPKEVQTGLDYIEDMAKAGIPEAMSFLSEYLKREDRHPTSADLEKAEYYGCAVTAVSAALMYKSGLPFRPSHGIMKPEEAFAVLKTAVDEYKKDPGKNPGYIFGGLGHCYEKGIGCAPDIQAAIKLYETGLGLNDPVSYLSLGRLYQSGQGVEEDQVKADSLLRQAALLIQQKRKERQELIRQDAQDGQNEQAEKEEKDEKNNEVSLGEDFVFTGNILQ